MPRLNGLKIVRFGSLYELASQKKIWERYTNEVFAITQYSVSVRIKQSSLQL